jgi:hypothetical protein
LAQDLAGEEAFDISNEVQVSGNSLRITGKTIRQIGLQNATAKDKSAPGLVISIV